MILLEMHCMNRKQSNEKSDLHKNLFQTSDFKAE